MSVPTEITLPAGVTFSSVGVGFEHACAIGSDSKAYCWGKAGFGRLGNGTNTPDVSTPTLVTMPSGITFTAISVGYYTTCAIGSNSKTYCWGEGSKGEIGNSATSDQNVPTEVTLPSGVTFSKISSTGLNSCAIGSDSNTYCWGQNEFGATGNGTTSVSGTSSPTPVSLPSGVTFTKVNTGNHFAIALGSDSKSYSWGYNNVGTLGNGNTTSSSTPVLITLPTGITFTSVRADNGYKACAIGSNGSAYCWGQGGLGNGSSSNVSTPGIVTMPSATTFSKISGGQSYACALNSDLTQAYCWGEGSNGQIGNGGTSDVSVPTAVTMPN